MRARATWLGLACLAALALLSPGLASAGTRQSFDKAVKDLQKSPNDMALRKKILSLANELPSLPDTPDDVAILKGKAAYIVKEANNEADFAPAVRAYQEAILLAPWLPRLYYNLGVVQQSAGQPADATQSFKLYLAGEPEAEDREKVLERLGKLQVQQEQQVGETQAPSASTGRRQAPVVDAATHRQWQGKRTGAIVVGVLGGVGLALGAIELGAGLGDQSSAVYTTSAGYYKGVLYNKYYQGKYWSSSSYALYTQGETEVAFGWTGLLLGGTMLLVAIVMDPGPEPRTAMLDIDGGKLAMGLPVPEFNENLDGVHATLLHASF
jgi:tetratricopeptide (TPR) repeat protein